MVHDENELYLAMESILKDEKIRSDLKENAKDIVALNQGSTDTQVSYILNILGAKH